MISASEIRHKYFEFFQYNGHHLIPSASLIPENDPTVLFTTAGMHPLVPYLLGDRIRKAIAWLTRKNASGQTILMKLATRLIILFLKCSAIGRLAIILRTKQLLELGIFNRTKNGLVLIKSIGCFGFCRR